MNLTQAKPRDDTPDARDNLSALVDGALAGAEIDTMFGHLNGSVELQTCWREYHLIGDALRGDCLPTGRIRKRLMAQLVSEPTVLAPRRSIVSRPVAVVALAASLMAVAIVSWNLVQHADEPQTIALSPRDFDRVNPYLAAHQEFSSVAGMAANPMAMPALLSAE